MAKLCCLNKNYEWPNFGNQRYSHGPETVLQFHSHVLKTFSWHNSNSPTNCLSPPFYGDYRHGFVSRGFQKTLINLTATEHLLLQLNKLNNFSCDIDHMELCPAALHIGHKSLKLHLQLLNICHWDIFECTLNYIGNTVMLFTFNSNKVTLLRQPRMFLF